jgi:hypothetical protein
MVEGEAREAHAQETLDERFSEVGVEELGEALAQHVVWPEVLGDRDQERSLGEVGVAAASALAFSALACFSSTVACISAI